MNDEQFLRYLRDKDEIIGLINQYAVALDERRWELLPDLFTPDVEVNYGGIERSGVDAVVGMIQAHLGGCGPSQHLFSNYRVSVDGDQATALFYGRVMHAGVGDESQLLFDFWGEYQDRLLRTDHGWRCYERRQRPFHATGDISILKGA